jgi:hypothetical protein
MPYDLEKVIEKKDSLPPEQREPFDDLVREVDFNIIYAKHVLNTTNWWLGYRGALMGTPVLTLDPDIPTACVSIDPYSGMINYYFNLYFAASLSPGDIAFVMAHECLHIVLGHLESIEIFKIEFHQIWNIVTDAFINEYLLRSLRWKKGAKDINKIDWITSNGIRWTDLPEEIQAAHPLDEVKGEVEVTAIQIYDEFIAYLEAKGVDPNKFEKEVENKRLGRQIKRKKRADENQRGSGDKGEPVYQKVYTAPGDMVWVKSKGKYGIIKDLRRTKDQIGEADIDCDGTLSLDDFREVNRAIGITTAVGKKSYANSRKIIDAYGKLKAAADAAGVKPSWDDLARAVGVPEIGELTGVDIAKEKYDAGTIMTPEEMEAESVREHNKLVQKARTSRQAAQRGSWAM